jgi:hypothetical protein
MSHEHRPRRSQFYFIAAGCDCAVRLARFRSRQTQQLAKAKWNSKKSNQGSDGNLRDVQKDEPWFLKYLATGQRYKCADQQDSQYKKYNSPKRRQRISNGIPKA